MRCAILEFFRRLRRPRRRPRKGRIDTIPLTIEAGISLAQMAQSWNVKLTEVEEMAIAALRNNNTPAEAIAKQLSLSLGRVQSSLNNRKAD